MHIPSHLRFLVPGVVASALVTARPGPRLVPSQHYQQRLVTFTSRFTSWNTSFLVNYRFALALRTAETDRRNERSSTLFFFIIGITIVIIIIIWERSFLLERLTTKKGKKERKKGKKRGKSNKSTRSGVGVPDASVG